MGASITSARSASGRSVELLSRPRHGYTVEIPFTDADVIPDSDEDDLAKEGNGED